MKIFSVSLVAVVIYEPGCFPLLVLFLHLVLIEKRACFGLLDFLFGLIFVVLVFACDLGFFICAVNYSSIHCFSSPVY